MNLRRPSRVAVGMVLGGLAIAALVVFGLGLPWWALVVTAVVIGVVVTFNS